MFFELLLRSHRLTVRTPGFHPGNPGSIPGEITKINNPSADGLFILVPHTGSNAEEFELCQIYNLT